MAASRCKEEMILKERRREGNEFLKLLFPNKRFGTKMIRINEEQQINHSFGEEVTRERMINQSKLFSEIKERGSYKRGDIELYLNENKEKFEAHGIYYPKLKVKIEFPKPEIKSLQVEEKDGKFYLKSSGQSVKNALEPIIYWINSVHYSDHHITRRAGCFIEIKEGKVEKIGRPKLKYCPLAERTFSMPFSDESIKEGFERRIKEGTFCGQRCVYRRDAWVLYGASEMLADALEDKKIDAAVTVCEGVGTVITDKPEVVQGIGAKMTGVFYTTPIKKIMEKLEEKAYVVFPNTAEIDQIRGARFAKEAGYERIAVTLAGGTARKLHKLREIDGTTALALCTTGIKEFEAYQIKEYADIAWGCGSRHIREMVGPSAFLQIGVHIPVFVLTKEGFEIASSRIKRLDGKIWERIKGLDFTKKYCLWREWPSPIKEGFRLEVERLPVRGNKEPHPLL